MTTACCPPESIEEMLVDHLKRPMWHDPSEHARDFAERYAEPMNCHAENRMNELGIPTDRIGARKYGYSHRAFWPEETTGGGNVPGRRLTVDSGVFNTERNGRLIEPEALSGKKWAAVQDETTRG